VINGDKLHRITFSRAVAQRIAVLSGPGFEAKPIEFKLGRELAPGERSRNGLYALLARKRDQVLRISMIQEAADLLCDYESRYIRECYVVP
jgi:hypothetical protein